MTVSAGELIVGRIVGVHGIRGQVKVYSDCRPRESIFSHQQFCAQRDGGEPRHLQLLRGNTSGKNLIASFAGITTRDQAAELIGMTLTISRAQLPPTNGDEFYWVDLIGLTVHNRAGQHLGVVSELFETGANDVLVVKNGQQEILIPFIRPTYIEKIDLTTGQIWVDWEIDWSHTDDKE